MWLSIPNESVHDMGVKAIMNIDELKTIEDLEKFLSGTQPVIFAVEKSRINLILGFKKYL